MTLSKRLMYGLGEAAWSTAACALIAMVVYANDGDSIVREGGTPLTQLLLIYATMGVASGLTLGLVKPMMKGTVGTLLSSIPVAWPPAFSIMLLARDGRVGDLDFTDYVVSIVLAAVFGPLTAAYIQLRKKGESGD